GQFVDRPVAGELLPAAADGLQGLGQYGFEGAELGVHVRVRPAAQLRRVGAALGRLVVRLGVLVGVGVAAEQLGAAAVDRPEGLGEDDLEVGEFAVDVLVGLGADLLRLPARLGENPVGLRLRAPGDLGVGDQRAALLVGGG